MLGNSAIQLFMNSADITLQQAESFRQSLQPMLQYLGALRERMFKMSFPADDLFYCQVDRAYDAIFAAQYSCQRIAQGNGWFLSEQLRVYQHAIHAQAR